MKPKIRIVSVKLPDDETAGMIQYEIESPDGSFSYMGQPFRLGQHGGSGQGLYWGWDGNREKPTLTPSFLCTSRTGPRVHLFLTAGEIRLCGDSTVEVAP